MVIAMMNNIFSFCILFDGLMTLIIVRFGCVCVCVCVCDFVVENGLKEEVELFLSAGADVNYCKVWLCLWFCCDGEDFIFFDLLQM